jgi:hypothetical protein
MTRAVHRLEMRTSGEVGPAWSFVGRSQQMTGHTAEAPVEAGEPPTVEVRWIRPGVLDARMLEWFRRFPAATESRADDYLISPDLDGLSVKIRGGRALEVKMYRGGRGVLTVPGQVRGFLEAWQRWSFPVAVLGRDVHDSTTWRPVRKVRRITLFAASEARLSARVPAAGRDVGCAVELTEVTAQDGTWWTLGLEATGPPDELPALVEATATLMFQQPLPADLELSAADCGSYHGWLRNRLGAAEPATRGDDHAAPRPHE